MFFLYFFLYGNQYVPLRNVPPSRKQMILSEQLYTASVPMEHTELTPVKREAERVNKKGETSDCSPAPSETHTSPLLQEVSSICYRHFFFFGTTYYYYFFKVADSGLVGGMGQGREREREREKDPELKSGSWGGRRERRYFKAAIINEFSRQGLICILESRRSFLRIATHVFACSLHPPPPHISFSLWQSPDC